MVNDEKYNRIINLPRHVSKKHPKMSNYDRAAQFSPFAALTSYDDAVKETARETSEEIEIGEECAEKLNAQLASIIENIDRHPEIEVVYFVPDKKKAGGEYRNFTGKVRRIDTVNREMHFIDRSVIDINRIVAIKGDLLKDD